MAQLRGVLPGGFPLRLRSSQPLRLLWLPPGVRPACPVKCEAFISQGKLKGMAGWQSVNPVKCVANFTGMPCAWCVLYTPGRKILHMHSDGRANGFSHRTLCAFFFDQDDKNQVSPVHFCLYPACHHRLPCFSLDCCPFWGWLTTQPAASAGYCLARRLPWPYVVQFACLGQERGALASAAAGAVEFADASIPEGGWLVGRFSFLGG